MRKFLFLIIIPSFILCRCDTAKNILGNINNGTLTNDEVVAGLKQALEFGTDTAAMKLSVLNGFLAMLR